MKLKPVLPELICIILVSALNILLAPTGSASDRRFTFVYEATTSAPNSVELENWVTWAGDTRENSRFNRVEFRHELEFGITKRLQIALYLADWSYLEDPDTNTHGFKYNDSAVELIYNLTNPTTDLLGSAVYGEVRGGEDFLELEGKVILQKNVGRFVAAYNTTLEAEWEGDHLAEQNGEFAESLGLSFEVSPRILIGAELLHEIALPEWSESGDSVVYGGPNISYRQGNWWATITPLIQATCVADESRFQTRLIVGFNF